ncbi:nucleotide-diphospho-sugar transferase [Hortaea werneckii]|nr:nucleotide-diphospho-sugar transferase [Hortaea werneckii]KAI7305369.1 nucleotide-diphospho-sugar transferase [Hortaea werneckii]
MGPSGYRNPSQFRRRSSRAYVSLYAAIAIVLGFALFVLSPLPDSIDHHRDAVVSHLKGATVDNIHFSTSNSGNVADNITETATEAAFASTTASATTKATESAVAESTGTTTLEASEKATEKVAENAIGKATGNATGKSHSSLNKGGPKYAYATFLAGDSSALSEDKVLEHDKYFVATRILAYQLLHAPETKSKHDYPFIVLVTSDVSTEKRERLRKDGAIVWEAPAMDAGWVKTDVSTWQNVMSKLRLWELTEYERICFLDGDTILTDTMDGIFEDAAAAMQESGQDQEATEADEAAVPTTYVFAGVPEPKMKHHYPPSDEEGDWYNINYLNAGFFVLQPSQELLSYYTSLTTLQDRFDPHLPEQNLLNYAHRREGNMPWKQLDSKWNMHYPSMDDLEGGVVSLHEKWWAPVNPDLAPFLLSWRWRMEGYYEGIGGGKSES